VLEMAETDVERREGEPGAVGLRDALRQLRLQVAKVPRRGNDALRGVHEVLEPQVAGSVFGDLHQPADARGAGGGRVPLRLLVGDGREETPLDAALLLGIV